jgi:hypothetical protein
MADDREQQQLRSSGMAIFNGANVLSVYDTLGGDARKNADYWQHIANIARQISVVFSRAADAQSIGVTLDATDKNAIKARVSAAIQSERTPESFI